MTDPVVRLRGQVVQRPKEQVGLPGGIVDWLDCGFVGFFGPKTPRSR